MSCGLANMWGAQSQSDGFSYGNGLTTAISVMYLFLLLLITYKLFLA